MGLMLKKPEGEPGSAWVAITIGELAALPPRNNCAVSTDPLAGIFVAFGGILFGYDTGTISGIIAMPYWLKGFNNGHIVDGEPTLKSGDKSLIVSILSLGTFLGALTAAPTADFFGRRLGLILSTGIVFNLGVLLQTIATSQPLFIAGRFFAGYGVGLISAQGKSSPLLNGSDPRSIIFSANFIPSSRLGSLLMFRSVPLYQSETAPKWIRGTIVGAYQLAITIGLFLAAIVNNGTKDRNDSGSYRIPVAIQFAWAIILIGGLLILPETPRYLVMKGNHEKAARSFSRLRRLDPTHPSIVEELNEVRANHEYEVTLGKASYAQCFKGTVGKRLFTGCALQGLQQLSGVNFIFYYGTEYFKRAGFQNPFTIQVITNTVNVVTTFPGLYLVEKLGRRGLLLLGAVGMTISQFIVAIVGTVSGTTDLPAQRAGIAFTCIYIYFFASSWGPVAWVVTGEMFPLKVRARALSMTTATNWLLNFVIAFSTPYLVDAEFANLQSKVFFIWGCFCLIAIVFVYTFIYETKGLTLEQVDELYGVVSKAWKSKAFRPKVNFREVEGGERQMSLRELSIAQERRHSKAEVENKEV
jgi:MFS transporter, SP family, sugar:H+ symporter